MASTIRSLVILFSYLPIPFMITCFGNASASPSYTEIEADVNLIHKRVRRSIDPTTGLRVQRVNYHINVTAAGATHSLNLEHGGVIFGAEFKTETVHTNENGGTIWTDVTPSPTRLAEIEDNIYRDVHKNTVVHIDEDDDGQLVLKGIVNNARIRPRPQVGPRQKRDTKPVHIIAVETPGTEVEERSPPTIYVKEGGPADRSLDTVDIAFKPPVIPRGEKEPLFLQPELAIVIEYNLLQQIKAAGFDPTVYMAITVASVNAKYSLTFNPSITAILNKVVPIVDEETQRIFMEPAKSEKVPGKYDLGKILVGFEVWAFKHMDKLLKHDISPLQVGVELDEEDLQGKAPTGGACRFSIRQPGFKEDTSVATPCSKDFHAYFQGSLTLAHEMGHNMGAPHDGEGKASKCSWDLGYIMSYKGAGTIEHFKFSNCSLELIDTYARSDEGKCLTTHSGNKEPLVPEATVEEGEKVTVEKICDERSAGWLPHFQQPDDECREVKCHSPTNPVNISRFSYLPGNGFKCGNGGHCRNGWCIKQGTPLTLDELCAKITSNPEMKYSQANGEYDPCKPPNPLYCKFTSSKGSYTMQPPFVPIPGTKCHSDKTRATASETKVNNFDGFCFLGKCITEEEFSAISNPDKECILKTHKKEATKVQFKTSGTCKQPPLVCQYKHLTSPPESEEVDPGDNGKACKTDDDVAGVCKNGACVLPEEVAPSVPGPGAKPGEPGPGSGQGQVQGPGKPSPPHTIPDVCRQQLDDLTARAQSTGPDRNSRCKSIECIGKNGQEKVLSEADLEGSICGPLRRCKKGKCESCHRSR